MRYDLLWDSLPTFRVNLLSPSSRTRLDPCIWDRQIVPKRRYGITITRCAISQKKAGLSYLTSEGQVRHKMFTVPLLSGCHTQTFHAVLHHPTECCSGLPCCLLVQCCYYFHFLHFLYRILCSSRNDLGRVLGVFEVFS